MSSPFKPFKFDELFNIDRNSEGFFYNPYGQYRKAPANAPRFGYDPLTKQPLGLLIEPQRQNLLSLSEDIGSSPWILHNATADLGVENGLDGSLLAADKLVENSSTVQHWVDQVTPSVTSGQWYCHSVFAKAAERSVVQLLANSAQFGVYHANFDLSAGVVSDTSGTVIAGIENVGDGWYRCYTIVKATGSGVSNAFTILANSPVMPRFSAYSGDGSSGLILWGHQFEDGDTLTSYIKTSGTALTRLEDKLSIANGAWFQENKGTFYFEMVSNSVSQTIKTFLLMFKSGENRRHQMTRSSDGIAASYAVINDALVATEGANATAFTQGQLLKMAASYDENETTINANGSIKTEALLQTAGYPLPTQMNLLRIGHSYGTFENLSGYVKRVKYLPSRFDDSDISEVVE